MSRLSDIRARLEAYQPTPGATSVTYELNQHAIADLRALLAVAEAAKEAMKHHYYVDPLTGNVTLDSKRAYALVEALAALEDGNETTTTTD